MDDASWHTGAGVGLKLKALTGEILEQSIRLDFSRSNNEMEYEAILVRINLTISLFAEKIIIQSDSSLVVRQVNREYEKRDQHMAKYVSLVKLRLGSYD